MTNTIIARKLLGTIIAVAVFAIGASIGWQFAGRLFQRETALPMVATIRLEGNGAHEPFRTGSQPRDAAVIRQDIEGQGPNRISTASPLLDEEREFAKTMQWAERYRQQHAALERSAVARHGWAEVAKHARHFGQGRADIQKVIQAQIERERRLKTTKPGRIASAAMATSMPLVDDAAPLAAQVRMTHCTRSCGGKAAHMRSARRSAHRRSARTDRATGGRRLTSMCVLQWLEAILTQPAMERRGHRHARRTFG